MTCCRADNSCTDLGHMDRMRTENREISAGRLGMLWHGDLENPILSQINVSMAWTYRHNMSTKSQIMDAFSQRVHNVDTFSAELYEQMADLPAASACAMHADRSRNVAQAGAEELDAVIRRNLEVLGYGE